MNDPGASYDELPYPSSARKYTHPIYLCSAAALAGFDAPPPSKCRVLEIGCSDAGNMLNMALTLPGATFTGIDLSAKEIEAGRAAVDALGLTNISLMTMDVMDFDAPAESFDYIIVHGVFSWVPASVRRKILGLCSTILAPNGVAFISYNTYPGCRLREAVRDLARFGARGADSPEAAVAAARNTIGKAVELNASEHDYYTKLLVREKDMLASVPDSFVAHDVLETENQAYYFREFAAEITPFGLEHFSDTTIDRYRILYPPEPLGQMFAHFGSDLHRREQQLDLFVGRQFRESLLCRTGVAGSSAPLPASVTAGKMVIASRMHEAPTQDQCAPTVPFASKSGNRYDVADPLLTAALRTLQHSFPQALTTAELCSYLYNEFPGATTDLVLTAFMEAYRTLTDSVEFWAEQFPASASAGDFPEASPVARRQAQSGARVSALNHETVELNPIQGLLLVAADGSRTINDLGDYLVSLYDGGELEIGGAEDAPRATVVEFLAQVATEYVEFFVKNALIVR